MLRRFLYSCLLLLVLALGLPAASLSAQDNVDPIKVAVNPIEPFVIFNGDDVEGFSVDLWQRIALDAELSYEFVQVESVTALLEAVESGEVDVGIGATSMTAEREHRVDFSYPFFVGGLQVLSLRQERMAILTTLSSIFTSHLLNVIGVTFVILLIVAHLAYFFEREHNPAFAGDYLHGIWNAFYWTVTTASTVGYGDTVLHRKRGKLLAVTWMLLSLFLVSYFTATVTTTLTLDYLTPSISDPTALRGRRIVTIDDTTSADYLSSRGLRFRSVDSVQTGVNLIKNGSADVFVYDAPVLRYQTTLPGNDQLWLSEQPILTEEYGIVLPQDSPLRESINRSLLFLIELGEHDRLTKWWFGE